MAFPDERDRNLIRRAEGVENLATDLCDWLAEHNPARRTKDLLPVPESDEFEVLQLRRLAGNLFTSSKVPVAAAVYGPSQVGKSLFIGQVLKPHSEAYSPLGRDEQHGQPAYFKDLSFDLDVNPQSGSNEATALVTRFTTKDRIAASVAPEYPVMVRALTRAEWLRVLARGFHGECQTPDVAWGPGELEDFFEELSKSYASREVDRKWRMDLLDAFTYMRNVDRRGFPAKEAVLNGLLSRYPLSDDGYTAAAAGLFWDNWDSLTGLFNRINDFLAKITVGNHDPALLAHWAAVRFLLDSQRTKVHDRRNSKCFTHVDWKDVRLEQKNDWYVLDWHPGRGDGNEELETIQAGMLELVMPVLPHRLNDDWRKVIEQMDFLDVPGMRVGRQGAEEGKRTTADAQEEQMEIVKRGKVAYLFERYTEELQIQTLLLLLRGGNVEVSNQMKYHVSKWGRARYGEKAWPGKVADDVPALFLGMTGLDEEFRTREDGVINTGLYDTRLRFLVDTLESVMTDFGGKGKKFSNVYPIRYPGTWDTDAPQRAEAGAEKWDRARNAFLQSSMVASFVRAPEQRWDTAMQDDDGGLSLIASGIKGVTRANEKQAQLEQEINEVNNRLLQLARGWVVDPDTNIDRQKRITAARTIVDWLLENEELVYYRVHALQQSLCVHHGDELEIADSAETVSKRHGDPLPKQVHSFLHQWATTSVPKRWEETIVSHEEGGPWLDANDVNTFARYLRDYLTTQGVFEDLVSRLAPVVSLKTRDEAARRRARRRYVRIILNDFVMNPGPSLAPIDVPEGETVGKVEEETRFGRFGLMASIVRRWANRLPLCLALGAGEHVQIPPGNPELIEILDPFEK